MTATLSQGDLRSAFPQLLGIDHLEWWVGNARAFAGWLASAFGFEIVAYAGPETGRRDRATFVLEAGRIRFMISGATESVSAIADHAHRHGDGVRDIAFRVPDVDRAYALALEHGASSLRPPSVDSDEHGEIEHAAIMTYGDTVHTLLDRSRYDGPFAPHFLPYEGVNPPGPSSGLDAVDHVVANVPRGALEMWVGFYARVFGFDELVHYDETQISTEYSALMSTVVWNGESIVLPINEPADGRRKSQIEEYLDFYGAPGVQHIAMRTDDLVGAVEALRTRGVRFMDVPETYYEEARRRVADFDLPWDELRKHRILVDRDADGYLLQIFTEMIGDRPTLFFEIIQREGAGGFGEGNFKALFESIERAQAARGNL